MIALRLHHLLSNLCVLMCAGVQLLHHVMMKSCVIRGQRDISVSSYICFMLYFMTIEV